MVVVEDRDASRPAVPVRSGTDTVIMRGDGGTTFVCGGCDAPVLVGVEPELVERFHFTCRACGAALRIPV